MVDRSNVTGGAGSCLGMVAIAVVSTGVILASYHLIHHRLQSNLKLNNRSNGKPSADQRRQSRKTKKKVRFTDDLTDADTEERPASAAVAAGSGRLVRPALRNKAAYSSTGLAC